MIGASLVAFVAAYGLSQAVVNGGGEARESFVQRVVSPNGEPVSVVRPMREWRGALTVRPGLQLSLGLPQSKALVAEIARSGRDVAGIP